MIACVLHPAHRLFEVFVTLRGLLPKENLRRLLRLQISDLMKQRKDFVYKRLRRIDICHENHMDRNNLPELLYQQRVR
jgi:hypothetical protein